ncbi:MAG: LPS assembly protein LptD [Bdellovibrionales bacterium]|nr:LPS assembly protein LptD [Bdellovibrionales bacterium]
MFQLIGGRYRWLLGVFSFLALSQSVSLAATNGALHWSARKQVWDRKTNIVSLWGSASLVQPGEVLTADEMQIDLRRRLVRAQGHCIFLSRDVVMQGQTMEFNLDSRNGTILGGRVSTENFTMSGERISRLGEGRFQAIHAEYTTCKDCPQSWSVYGEKVDLTFGGYARLSGVQGKVADVPITWFPYAIFPLKTERQSGLLLPRFRFSGSDGFVFVQPFFWAASRSVDFTLGLGNYSNRGFRAEIEGRYKLSDRNEGQANFFFLRDETYRSVKRDFSVGSLGAPVAQPSRWGFFLTQKHQLNSAWNQKLQVEEVRDTDYPSEIGDVPSRADSVLTSTVSLTRTTPQASIVLSAQRFRNRIGEDPMRFDTRVVQPLPLLTVTSNERPLIFGFNGGVTFGLARFDRGASDFDPDVLESASPMLTGGAPRFGVDPIRKATRLSLVPRLYYSGSIFDGISVVPSAEYRASYYDFPSTSGVGPLMRGYLLTQLDISSQLERVYDNKYKHLIRPRISYSLIPSVQESATHPFVGQMRYAQSKGFSGYNFDNLDIIPRDTTRSYNNYFLPLGNAVTFGFSSQLIQKKSEGAYSRTVELVAGQTLNFREYRLPAESRQPFSRFSSALLLEFERLSSSVNYFYYPYAQSVAPSNRNKVSANVAWNWQRGVRQRVLEFDRSISLGYQYDRLDGINRVKNLNSALRFSLTDSILPFAGLDYHLRTGENDPGKIQRANVGVTFQSVSQCWKASVNLSKSLERLGTTLDFDLALNLAGEGFGQSPIALP